MKLRLLMILSLLLLPGINGYCQEKGEEDYVIEYANNRRPMFDGDMSLKKFEKWVENHLRYPKAAKKEGIQGKVIVCFTVTKESKLTDVKVLRGCHPLLDAEAVRVIRKTSKKWTCGYLSATDEPCDVTFTYPVVFRL